MSDSLGQTFEGTVTGVTAFGLFVELDGIYATGLVHVSSLSNDYYHFDAQSRCLRGERSGVVHRLADKMKVKVARVDLDERKIDFELVEPDSAASKRGKPASKPNAGKSDKSKSSGKSRRQSKRGKR
jgi:ribonuclease R